MKSIEFIAPVESMRGNLSGKQDLVYAENDNKAYEAPANQRNYARNYSPRFIGAKRSSDGRKYFAVKTKTATTITTASKRAMSVMGGSGAIIGSILITPSSKAACQAQMAIENEQGYGWKSLRQFLSAKIRPALESKAADIVIAPVGGVFNNPWVDGGSGSNVQIANTTLTRFWSELANSPYEFKVSTLKAISHAGETFGDVIASRHNVLGLFKVPQGDDANCIKLGNQYVVEHEEVEGEIIEYQVKADTETEASLNFYLSDTKGVERE